VQVVELIGLNLESVGVVRYKTMGLIPRDSWGNRLILNSLSNGKSFFVWGPLIRAVSLVSTIMSYVLPPKLETCILHKLFLRDLLWLGIGCWSLSHLVFYPGRGVIYNRLRVDIPPLDVLCNGRLEDFPRCRLDALENDRGQRLSVGGWIVRRFVS
jgi:hypothetical protein